MNSSRIRTLNSHTYSGGNIAYWMSRDQRTHENWALIHAYEQAKFHNKNLLVFFNLLDSFQNANKRTFDFMIEGLNETVLELTQLNIPFILLHGEPVQNILESVEKYQVGYLVTDFSPLKTKLSWNFGIIKKTNIPFVEVDAHNIVPCWIASQKQEYGAYTFRPRITRLLNTYLDKFPNLEPLIQDIKPAAHIEFPEYTKNKFFKSGTSHALEALEKFKKTKLQDYEKYKNDPNSNVISNLSPYLHFGQISSQTVVQNLPFAQVFFEEIIVRKELSDNFCFYNSNYDTVNAFPTWATKTLKEHENDKRDYIYTYEQFETSQTHDSLWNAAQTEMVKTGKMHGYMRMYWAKKILEWTPNAKQALEIALRLNDTYELDGRDPNGYAGIAWSIGGVHDRPWFDRSIYGSIRYMNENGARKKFDVDEYISRVSLIKD